MPLNLTFEKANNKKMKQNKQKENTKPQHIGDINNSSGEIPQLTLIRVKTLGDSDFEKEHLQLSARGWDMQSAIAGFEYILRKALKKVDKNK